MKRLNQYTFFLVLLLLVGCTKDTKSPEEPRPEPEIEIDQNERVTVSFKADDKSLIRNPGMGWTLYDDGIWTPANANTYWEQQGEYANKYASTFYIRWRWSDFEPEEGKYAWDHDENFKALVKGAIDRKLKLAFRVYVDGQDNQNQATPDFVRKAGARGYNTSDGRNHWNPYVDDAIFQEKYSNFVKAFATKFDDPEIVDYVDVYNIGYWGEGHNAGYINYDANKDKTDRWLINLYGDNFKRVIPVFLSNILQHINTSVLYDDVLGKQQMALRRDGLGSRYLEDREVSLMLSSFPKTMIVGEQAYYGGNDLSGDWKPFRNDHLYTSNSVWRDNYRLSLAHAYKLRANYMDLRNHTESKGWVETSADYVQEFMIIGGYRFYPSKIVLDKYLSSGKDFNITHEWNNMGLGVCPNKNKRWNNKFKVAFALIDANDQIKKTFVDTEANPGDWVGGDVFKYNFKSSDTKNLPSGKYTLVLAIINDQNEGKPGINLAIENQKLVNGWTTLTEVTVL